MEGRDAELDQGKALLQDAHDPRAVDFRENARMAASQDSGTDDYNADFIHVVGGASSKG